MPKKIRLLLSLGIALVGCGLFNILPFLPTAAAIPTGQTATYAMAYAGPVQPGSPPPLEIQLNVPAGSAGFFQQTVSLDEALTTSSNGVTYYHFNGTQTQYFFSSSSSCLLNLDIMVANNNFGSGSFRILQTSLASSNNNVFPVCTSQQVSQAQSAFNQPVPISNASLASAELGSSGALANGSADITVVVPTDATSASDINASTVPQTDTVTLNGPNNSTASQTTDSVIMPSGPDTTLSYKTTFKNLAPGNYKACSQLLKGQCSDFSQPPGADSQVTIDGSKNTSAIVNASSSSPSGSSGPSCEASGASLSWILCPIVTGISKTVDGIYNYIVKYLLQTQPLVANSSDPTFRAWSNFRIYGDIFLVIALLVVVFGESIGGGLIDAYTAKKILPRLLGAAILINLSFYIVALLVDVTNILGSGIIALITTPFGLAHNFSFQYNAGTSTLAVGGLSAAVAAGIAGGTDILLWLWAFVLLPALLIFLAILVTVLLRRALIVLLVIVSPVAFALYTLPNTERVFRRWWKTLFETLLVYPIIAALFGVSKVLSVLISQTGNGAPTGVLSAIAGLLSIVALVIPLILIPYSFKLAGGIIGSAHEALTNYGRKAHQSILGNPNDLNSMRNKARYGVADRFTQLRERGVNAGYASGAGLGRRTFSRALNYGNLQAKRSQFNKQRSEMLQSQIATGDDTNIRDLFIAWDPTANGGRGAWYRRMDMKDGRAVPGAKSVYDSYAIGNMAHSKSMGLYGGDKSAVQDALYYEWKKTSFEPNQMSNLVSRYNEVLDEHKFNEKEGAEMGKAVGFRHQGQSLASKYSTFGPNKATGEWGMQFNHVGLAKEGAFNIGTYAWSNQDVTTFNELGNGYNQMGQLLQRYGESADENTIIGQNATEKDALMKAGFGEYVGSTTGQLKEARRRIAQIAQNTNPDQRVPGGGRVETVSEEGSPQMAGYGGVSNAPVEVQEAARSLYRQIYGSSTGGGSSAGTAGNYGDDRGYR